MCRYCLLPHNLSHHLNCGEVVADCRGGFLYLSSQAYLDPASFLSGKPPQYVALREAVDDLVDEVGFYEALTLFQGVAADMPLPAGNNNETLNACAAVTAMEAMLPSLLQRRSSEVPLLLPSNQQQLPLLTLPDLYKMDETVEIRRCPSDGGCMSQCQGTVFQCAEGHYG